MPQRKMKTCIRILILSSALLAGCATKQDKLKEGLQALHGKRIDVATQRLGAPVGEENIAGTRVLVWSVNETRTENLKQTTTASVGAITAPSPFGPSPYATPGSSPSGDKPHKYGLEFTVNTPVIVHAHCTIRLSIGKDDIVLGSNYDGDLRSCLRYIYALNPDDQWLFLRQWHY